MILDKETIKEMLLTIENDKELKHIFCDMMDSYHNYEIIAANGRVHAGKKTLDDKISDAVASYIDDNVVSDALYTRY